MANSIITNLTTLTSVATNDYIPVVDVSDTTDASSGTTKKITQANLTANLAPINSPTFTGSPTIPTPFVLGAVTVLPTGTELNYVSGVTSAIQTQLNNKQPLDADLTTIAGLGDPGADRILFFDESGGGFAYLTVGAGLSIVGTAITSSGSGGATPALDNLAAVAINAALVLATSDAFALGSATKMWSDLFLASGAVINFNNGDVTLTHSSGTLSLGSGTLITTGTIKLDTLAIQDSTNTYFGSLSITDAMTASRTISLVLGDANRTISLGSDFVLPADPNADRILFWDDSAGSTAYLTAGSGLSISGTTITATGAGVGTTWSEVTGTSQSAAVNSGYICNNAGLVTVTLPSTAAVGDIVEIAGKGAGLWKVAQNASGQINFGNQATTAGTGGSLAATNRYDSLKLVCITANNIWVVLSSVGNITIV